MFTCFSYARQNVAEKMEIIAGELPKGDCSQKNVREVGGHHLNCVLGIARIGLDFPHFAVHQNCELLYY